MKKNLSILTIILLSINICYASADYYCNGKIVNTNTSAELFCKPLLDLINDIYRSEHNKEAYEHNMRMYQNCLDSYNRAKTEMQKGLCKPAIKRVYKGSCEETTTEYVVSGNVVQKYSTGGNPACVMKQIKRASDELDEFQRKFINGEVDINGKSIK